MNGRNSSAESPWALIDINNSLFNCYDCLFEKTDIRYDYGSIIGVNKNGIANISNTIFLNNYFSRRGNHVFFNNDAELNITNSTFWVNFNIDFNDSYIVNTADDGVTKVVSSIVRRKYPDRNPISIYGPATVAYSCITNGYEGYGNIDVDPMFR